MKKIGILFWDEKRFGGPSYEMNKNLIYAVEEVGALPMGIPSVMDEEEMDTYLSYLDGIILTGGEDIGPFLYGEDPRKELGKINIFRDRSEYAFIKKIFDKKMPCLALCRGMQMANIVKGGSLYQDIKSQKDEVLVHFLDQNPEMDFNYNFHRIEVEKGSILHKALGDTHIVNSYHHQAIKDLGQGLRVVARSSDGIIEGVELEDPDHYFTGVQFHPEFTEESEGFKKLFENFIGGIDLDIPDK